MENRALALEALSAIMGCEIRLMNRCQQRIQENSQEIQHLCPQKFINRVMLLSLDAGLQSVTTPTASSSAETLIKEDFSIQWFDDKFAAGLPQPSPQKFIKQSTFLPADHKQPSAETPATGLLGKPKTASEPEIMFIQEDFFDPPYDYDYTNINDGGRQFKRGNEPYVRPCGWNRYALKVLNKYGDGDRWLGTGPDAWPVSYHGTSKDASDKIIHGHYVAGNGAAYGRGIYSTPNISVASSYAKTFTSKKTNKKYKVVLQNRINPKIRQVTQKSDYWLVPVPKGTSADAEKEIVESAIRPYGLLLREV